eukprot:TRINITY_DN7798_c0_g1_i1.p1 TRINITY_DN7798_c0_g1~~TRINITY_DN7798_c0_g1_i1.p1  ORF type:complete len:220 (-),score=65.98 TRINITY_DN7798_c0_g1_i1:67-705(-)
MTEDKERSDFIVACIMAEAPSLNQVVVEYLAEQIVDSDIKTNKDLVATVGEWMESESYSHKEVAEMCGRIFASLQRAGIVPGYVPPPPPPKEEKEDGEDEDEEDGEDGELLSDGECELCEREMPLTKHHVIPREMHERYVKKGFTKKVLNQGITICRPCHNAVHSFFDNKTLADKYNTVDTLLETEQMQKWIPYIRKQKIRSKRIPNLNYAR